MNVRTLSLALVVALAAVALVRPPDAVAAESTGATALAAFGEFRDQVDAILEHANLPSDVAKPLSDALRDAHTALHAADAVGFVASLTAFSEGVSSERVVDLLGTTAVAGLLGGEMHLVQYLGAIGALPPDLVTQITGPLQSLLIALLVPA